MINWIKGLTEGALFYVVMALIVLLSIGNIYWLWMSIKIGSFGMFFMGIFPLFYVVTAPVGAWSILFGMPHWVYNTFG